jgi:uncharacterized protein YecE (DUF72 family)
MKTAPGHQVHGEIRIGISGWTYAPWRGKWYPKGLTHKRELEYASRQVRSIEINGTFYSLQRPKSFQAWYDATPPDFVFAVKAPRYITHVKRLKDTAEPLANFFASGMLCLKEKLGPVLWQFPPSFKYQPELMTAFFKMLPASTTAALRLARKHNAKVQGRTAFPKIKPRPMRHAIEVRHPSFVCPEFVEQLREFDVALVVADTAGRWPFMEDLTSDFIYLRLHGDEELYVSGYTQAALKTWQRKIHSWARGRQPRGCRTHAPRDHSHPGVKDVYAYFDNDVKVHAPYDAIDLAHKLHADAPTSSRTKGDDMAR